MGKKKKAPARGVMTTSIPSKAQITAQAAAAAAAAAEEEAKIQASVPAPTETSSTAQDASTELLEKGEVGEEDAEESQLQLLVEKLGPRAKKESQRCIERLIAERRMLRTAGAGGGMVFPIYIEGLLGLRRDSREIGTLGFAERIFQLAKKEASLAWTNRDANLSADENRNNALLSQTWMIFRSLTSLGFTKEKVESAITEVIGKGKVGIVSGEWDRLPGQMVGVSKGDGGIGDLNIGLLDEVLDWLGMESDEQDLPRFDGGKRGAGEEREKGSPGDSSASKPGSGASTPVPKDNKQSGSKRGKPPHSQSTSQVSSGSQTPKSIAPSKLSLEPLDIEDGGAEVNEDIDQPCQLEENEDDDISPEELLPRWLELKQKLLILDPAIALGGKAKRKGPQAPINPKVETIRQKIQKIERDPFFDTRKAGEMWEKETTKLKDSGALKTALSQQSQGRKGGKKKNDWWAEEEEEPKQKPEPVVESVSNEEEEGLFGGIFEGPVTEEVSSNTQEKIVIRDFEQVKGETPKSKFDKNARNRMQTNVTVALQVRKVVEEVVKSKDSRAKVTYTSISGTTYSSRHSLAIRWSKPEHMISFLNASALSPDGSAPYTLTSAPDITMTVSQNVVTFSMTYLAAPSPVQSEAYISTVVLYQLYGGSTCAGGKGSLRLQGVWKDLWAEFIERDRLQEEKAEREVLKQLKGLVLSEYAKEENTSNTVARIKKKAKEENTQEVAVDEDQAPLPDWRQKAEGEVLREEWEYRINSHSYLQMLEYRKQLPMWSFKKQILDALITEQVIIICGETGCGKSTQVPAFILENELSNGRACRVYCTEPRRISAISLARRVSQELGEGRSDLGTPNSLVGYAIRLESCMGKWSRLVYATTGIVMRMLERSTELEDITHLVLDEVHERSIDSDFLLIVLKKLLVKRRNLKVILMSATVDAERFSKYLNNALVLNVPGRTFPVTTQYLEDAIELTKYSINEQDTRNRTSSRYGDEWDDGLDEVETNGSGNNSTLTGDFLSGYSRETRTTLSHFNEYQIQYDLIVRLIETIATNPQYIDYSKAILVFLPGIGEIRKLNDHLMGHHVFGGHGVYGSKGDWLIYPLHSTIASEEQEAAFLVPPKGYRKIVLATNIAETGITIPDVTCVIDSGKHKEMRFDERRQLSRLIETFISRANAKQRRGRAGRVQEGLCFHLFTKERYNTRMASQQDPEMLRLSLQDLCLRVKICNLGAIEETLTMALDPPIPNNIRRAINSLIEVKALTSTEELTNLGRQLSKLPLDVYLGKLVLFGWMHGCLDAAITIAAILSSKSPFVANMRSMKEMETAKLAFKKGDSDLQTIYAAYCAWRRICSGVSANFTETQFCQRNYLSSRNLNAIEDLKGQLITCIVDAGFLQLSQEEKQYLARSRFQTFRRKYFFTIPQSVDSLSENDSIVNAVIAAGFYPKLLVKDGKGWRNVANNQNLSIHPGSVNRGSSTSTWLSYYGIMQSLKFYDAHETSHVDDLSIALLCGDIDFRLYAGVGIIDGHRIKFSFQEWKSLVAVKILRLRLRRIADQAFNKGSDPIAVRKGLKTQKEGEKEVLQVKEWMEIAGEVLGVKRKVLG